MSSDSSLSAQDLKDIISQAGGTIKSVAFYLDNRKILSEDIDRVMDNAIGKIEVVLSKLTPDQKDKAKKDLTSGHLKVSVKLTKEDVARVFYSLSHVETFCHKDVQNYIPSNRLMALRNLNEKLKEYKLKLHPDDSKEKPDETNTSEPDGTFFAARLMKLINLMNKVKKPAEIKKK